MSICAFGHLFHANAQSSQSVPDPDVVWCQEKGIQSDSAACNSFQFSERINLYRCLKTLHTFLIFCDRDIRCVRLVFPNTAT